MSSKGRARTATVALLVALGAGTGGCASGSSPTYPTGVDELTIPTSSPRAGDFVDDVDNPWLALEVGRSRTYRITGDGAVGTRVVSVGSGPQVDAVGTTSVKTETTWGATSVTITDYYAQDRRGNVWWFGRADQWLAGVDGAEAGLVISADPRLGDGYRSALAPEAAVDLRTVVRDTASRIDIDAGSYEGVVVLDTTDAQGHVERAFFARGVGLVYQQTQVGTPTYVVELVGRTQ